MLTRSTNFERFSQVSGEQFDVIIVISDGTDTWHFSGRPMPAGLNTAPVYPMFIEHSKLKEGADMYGRKFSVSDVTVTLNNKPYYPTAGSRPKRASDLIGGCNGGNLKIYQMAGSDITDIADCMLIFDGNVITCPSYNRQKMTVRAVDKGKMLNITLPLTVIADKFPDASVDVLVIPIPIIWGNFATPDLYDLEDAGTGLVRAVERKQVSSPYYVLADHKVDAIGECHWNIGGPGVIKTSKLFEINGDGDIPTQVRANPHSGWLHFKLSSVLPEIYIDESKLATDRENLHDDDEWTKTRWKDNVSDDGDVASGLGLWSFEAERFVREHLLNGGIIQAGYRYLDDTDSEIDNISELYFYLYYNTNGSDERVQIGWASTGASGDNLLVLKHGAMKYPSAYDFEESEAKLISGIDIKQAVYGQEFALGILMKGGTIGGSADGVVNNQWMGDIRESNIYMKFIQLNKQRYVWVGCLGKEYGSWVDNEGRDNPFNVSWCIQDPAMIVEDLFRSYLGLSDSDIDTESFDAAVNESVEARINLLSKTKAYDIVRRITEQSTFMVFYSGAGKLRAIALNDKDPDIVATIPREKLIDDSIEVSKTGTVVNKITVKSRWRGERNAFTNFNTYEDADSQAKIQSERTGHYEWQNIAGDSAVHVAQHLVNSTDGIWSKQHIKVKFSTPGFTYSHLQPGDWIRFDADVDGITKPYGGTWEGRNLLVVETAKDKKMTEIIAVVLYE